MRNPITIFWEKVLRREPGDFRARGYARATFWGALAFAAGLLAGSQL